MNKFYITTPIYYVNANPHIGHTYTTVAADVLARFHRLIGDKTFFLTGTDEHGAKIEEWARDAGLKPQEFVDRVSAKFQFIWNELNISNDRFIRTTESEHMRAVQNALEFMYKKGDIYKGEYEGLYCRGCEQFKTERDLIDGLCPDHKVAPELMKEECYMFKMSKYRDEILKKIEKDEFKILPAERKNEISSFYKNEKLEDVSFSRKNVKWGIPLPWDETHTTYVWADAFLNYLTGLGWTGPEDKNGSWREYWPADVHLMSKDILRVHATIWPAMLLSLGLGLPRELFIHGFFLVDGQKMSKSLGNVISPEDLMNRYGVDGTRYLLMSATPFGHDGDIGWNKFDEKYNADLANGIGNLVARSITLAEKASLIKGDRGDLTQNSKIPEAEQARYGAGKTQNHNLKFKTEIEQSWKTYQENLLELKIDSAIDVINKRIKFLDGYITEMKPWEMIKNSNENTGEVMYNVLESLRHVALMLWPFMPETAEKIYESLGLDMGKEMAEDKKFEDAIEWGGLSFETKIKKGGVLFPRIF